MTGPVLVIGIDPGPTTGLVAIAYGDTPNARPVPMILQCVHTDALFFLQTIIDRHRGYPVRIGLEQFVIGARSAKSSTSIAGQITRNLVGAIAATAKPDLLVRARAAGAVKPWATDVRLKAAGLYLPTVGMNHARDAARHALYAAVKADIVPDPLSQRLVAIS